MLIKKLRDYYGTADYEQAKFIADRTRDMSETEQDEIAEKIIESRPKHYGFPDVAALSTFLGNGAKKTSKYFWAVCDDCGAEYSYGFPKCPVCKLRGKNSSGYKVKVSQEPPHKGVVRWNQECFSSVSGEKICLDCESRGVNFCWMFGRVDAQCKREDFEACKCSACCVRHKRFNKQHEDSAGK